MSNAPIDYRIPERLARQLNREDGTCGACKSVKASEWHHIHPRNLGGAEDSPQAHLCGSCHNLIHVTAFRYRRGEEVTGLTTEQSTLSKYIAVCMGSPSATEDTLRKIVVQVPDRLLRRLHVRKVDSGFTNLSKFIISLLEKEAGRS